MKKRRRVSFLLALCLLCTLLLPSGAAEPTVYFTSVNDQLLPDVSDATMPFWSNGRLYVPYTAVSGTDLGVFYARSRDRKSCVVYRQSSALNFDLSAGTTVDQNGASYDVPALLRGDVVFLPVELLTTFFELEYSYTRVEHGYLVRIKSSNVVLSDANFIEAADSAMDQRYSDYLKTYNGGGNDGGSPTLTDDSVERAYLLVRVTDEETSGALLASLTANGAKATFVFGSEAVGMDALAREIRVQGSAIALSVDAAAGPRRTLAAIERANRALWRACNEKTRLVLLSGASDATVEAVREAGYCPVTLDLDYSGDELPASYRMASSISSIARKSGCAAYLGADSAVAESWSGLLTRLRGAGCPIAQLNELAASRES